MTALLERPSTAPSPAGAPDPPARARRGELLVTAAVAALVLTALVPYGRVFATGDWLVPVVAAGLAPVVLSWAGRRLGAPLWAILATGALAWLWFTAVVVLPTTLWNGIVPTSTTVRLLVDAAALGVERIAVLPAPVYPERPLLLIAIAGVWWVATCIDLLAVRLHSPGKAVVCALTLWVVPLVILPGRGGAWVTAAPVLLASVTLLLTRADHDVLGWGRVVRPTGGHGLAVDRRPAGFALGLAAVVLGGMLAGLLPGFGEPPWYEVQARAATTLTDNPIVQLRTNLVAQDTGPILRVRSERPVYLRSTALDQYSATEEWTTSEITPRPLVGPRVPGAAANRNRHDVRVEALDLSGAVLVPAPTGPQQFRGPEDVRTLYDPRTSTFTFDEATLRTGHSYRVVASTPEVRPAIADAASDVVPARLTALPASVPAEVGRLARRIVDDAGATSRFAQALAIQDELRTWEYSLRPPPGHSGVAMRTFLDTRVGYCEQFAGTMAVMLRTLDIPARVAVGFTPGTVDPDDPSLWTVTWANAHAWVEVLLGGQWIAFEPTPRADGNVLVPTAADLAPTSTAQAPDETAPPPPDDADAVPEFDAFDEREALANRQQDVQSGDIAAGGGGGGAAQVSQRLTDPAVVSLTITVALAALGALIVIGRAGAHGGTPAGRVAAVHDRVARVGDGLGRPRSPSETDGEYLRRLGGPGEETRVVAAAVTRARYAPHVGDGVATRAEEAGDALITALLAERPPWRRTLVQLRGDAAAGWRRLRAARWRVGGRR